jgi:hypothetical protein
MNADKTTYFLLAFRLVCLRARRGFVLQHRSVAALGCRPNRPRAAKGLFCREKGEILRCARCAQDDKHLRACVAVFILSVRGRRPHDNSVVRLSGSTSSRLSSRPSRLVLSSVFRGEHLPESQQCQSDPRKRLSMTPTRMRSPRIVIRRGSWWSGREPSGART